MKKIKHILALTFFIVTAYGFFAQSSHSELNGFYCNKFRQYVHLKDGNMDWYRSTYAYEFEKQEHYDYKYSNKKVVYKYDDIKLNYEDSKVISFDNRGRLYKKMNTIRNIFEVLRLDLQKNYKRINGKQAMTFDEFNETIDNKDYLKHTDVVVDKCTIDELVINMYKALK